MMCMTLYLFLRVRRGDSGTQQLRHIIDHATVTIAHLCYTTTVVAVATVPWHIIMMLTVIKLGSFVLSGDTVTDHRFFVSCASSTLQST